MKIRIDTVDARDPDFRAWLRRKGITRKVVREVGPVGYPEVEYEGSRRALGEMTRKWFDEPLSAFERKALIRVFERKGW
jgi:hypothetical protein